jgi:hypothetical protein
MNGLNLGAKLAAALKEAEMASTINPNLIKTTAFLLPGRLGPDAVAVGFEGVTVEEARALIDFVIKLEQARTGDVLSPTEYGNRFSGLDL